MTRRDVVIDGALAVVAGALMLAILASGGLGAPSPEARGVDPLGVLLVLASTMPLVARRRVPLTVYLATTSAALALFTLGYPADVPAGTALAVYTLGATYGGGSQRQRLVTGLAVAGFIPAIAVALAASGVRLGQVVPELLFMALALAGLWVVGDRSRLRRAHITELEARARRAETDGERERRVAVAEERTRIARELHDSVGHAINVVLMQAGAARLLHERDPAGSQQAIATIEQVARGTIAEIDQLVRAMRAGDPAQTPIEPAGFEELVAHHRNAGLQIVTETSRPGPELPRSLAWAAYRILQEALTNAARHGTGTAEVSVHRGDHAVEITVSNPYAGDSGRAGVGHGIVGMRERANLLGGALDVRADQHTFRLHARLPYPEPA